VTEATIRPIAGPAEAERCTAMMASSEPWITLGRGYEASLRSLSDTTKEVYVAEISGEVAGFAILNLHGSFPGYIQTVCVAAHHRGRGLGTRLIEWAERRIFRASPNVFLCVSSFNPDARRLYLRLGYEVVGELRDYLVRGHSEILLRKSRGPWSEHAPEAGG
jgi:ribosomal protein S18 acetylase RimI-like enzyme